MSDRQAPQDPDYAGRIGSTANAELEETFTRAKKAVIPAALVALVIIGLAFASTAKKESVRKANAAAYAALQEADDLDYVSEREEEKRAELRDKARAVLEAVVSEHAGTVAAGEAAMRLAALEFDAKNYDVAAAKFAEIAAAATDDPIRADTARMSQANALVAAEKFDEAVKQLETVTARAESAFKAEASFLAASVCYRSGDFANAKKHLEALLASDKADQYRSSAAPLLERLDSLDPETVKASFTPEPEPEASEEATPEATE